MSSLWIKNPSRLKCVEEYIKTRAVVFGKISLANFPGSHVGLPRGQSLDHIWWVVDEAYILSRKYKLTEEEQIILMVAAMWHDVGKFFCRSPKTRLLCNNCGRPHSETYIGVCKTDNCASSKFTPKIVMGYSEHEKIGSSKWMFGNISIREKLPSYIAVPSRELIKNHLIVLDAIKHEDEYPFNKLNVLLSLADEKGRDKPDFSVDYSKKFDIIISKYLKER